MIIGKGLARFTLWLALELGGTWAIWASYMAVKFIIEDAQGQRASFSVVQAGGQVGALVILPALATFFWTVVSVILASSASVKASD